MKRFLLMHREYLLDTTAAAPNDQVAVMAPRHPATSIADPGGPAATMGPRGPAADVANMTARWGEIRAEIV